MSGEICGKKKLQPSSTYSVWQDVDFKGDEVSLFASISSMFVGHPPFARLW
jgi:hypothetical protein